MLNQQKSMVYEKFPNKEVTSYKIFIEEHNEEIIKLKKINHDFNSSSAKLQKEIEDLKTQLDLNLVVENSHDKDVRKQQKLIELIKEEKQVLQNSYDLIVKENARIDNDFKELYKKNFEHELKLSDLINIHGKYDEIHKNSKKLKEEIDKVGQEKDCIDVERKCYKAQLEEKNDLIEKLSSNHKEIIEKLEKEKREFDKENQIICKKF